MGAYAGLAALTLIWGFNWPAMKVGLAEIPPWTFRLLTVPPAGLLLLLIARGAGLPIALPRGVRLPLAGLALLNVPVWYMLATYGLALLPVGRAALLSFTMPLWATLLGALILGERIGGRQAGALALGLGGIAVLMGDDALALGEAPLGAALMVASAMSWALGTVLVKARAWGLSTLALTGWQLLLGGFPIALGALLLEPQGLAAFSPLAWAATAYNSVLALAAGTYLWFRLLSRFSAGVSSVSIMAIPVVGLASGWALLGEPIGAAELAGLALILGALALTLLRR